MNRRQALVSAVGAIFGGLVAMGREALGFHARNELSGRWQNYSSTKSEPRRWSHAITVDIDVHGKHIFSSTIIPYPDPSWNQSTRDDTLTIRLHFDSEQHDRGDASRSDMVLRLLKRHGCEIPKFCEIIGVYYGFTAGRAVDIHGEQMLRETIDEWFCRHNNRPIPPF